MGRAVGLWILLFGLWLALSGHYTPLFLAFGLGTCTVAVYVSRRMGILGRESAPFHLTWGAVTYLPWLTWEILKSNVAVARIILSPSLPINPSMVHFEGSQKTDLGRFIYANSITLTPGTITTGILETDFEVHALTADAVDGSEENLMNRKVAALEGSGY
ncbi:MAG: Na+/H+ antiporter subunit E [Gemmatimonadetes bacterium]|nr:Na+/H+ antiporter subunit E [Gemmatimonadota bacterium]